MKKFFKNDHLQNVIRSHRSDVSNMKTMPTILSAGQAAMLNASLQNADSPSYFLQVVLEFDPTVDQKDWEAAWLSIATEESILRLSFAGGRPTVLPSVSKTAFETCDLRHLSDEDFRSEYSKLALKLRLSGFDFYNDRERPLWRSLWIKGSVSSAWCLTIHHSIIDGNSFKPLFQRVRDHFEKKSAPLTDGSESPQEWLESTSDKEHLSGVRYFAGLYSMADWVGNISSVFPTV
ncbi:MAG: hypothetical protein H7Y36_08400, partial [Armatimonadetes bacterium]|nr:hypothetical protein [Akkermansiaceae bacterium]